MPKGKRPLKNEALLKKVGVDYAFFNDNEIAEILKKSKFSYSKVLNKLENQTDFLIKSIKNTEISYDDYELLIKEIKKRIEKLKVKEIEKAEKQIEELKQKLIELKK
jgi:hypothetical protein